MCIRGVGTGMGTEVCKHALRINLMVTHKNKYCLALNTMLVKCIIALRAARMML